MHSEDRNDRDQIEHMLAPILAIDVWLISLNIPPQKKKTSLGTSDYKYFRGAFNTLWQKVWSPLLFLKGTATLKANQSEI